MCKGLCCWTPLRNPTPNPAVINPDTLDTQIIVEPTCGLTPENDNAAVSPSLPSLSPPSVVTPEPKNLLSALEAAETPEKVAEVKETSLDVKDLQVMASRKDQSGIKRENKQKAEAKAKPGRGKGRGRGRGSRKGKKQAVEEEDDMSESDMVDPTASSSTASPSDKVAAEDRASKASKKRPAADQGGTCEKAAKSTQKDNGDVGAENANEEHGYEVAWDDYAWEMYEGAWWLWCPYQKMWMLPVDEQPDEECEDEASSAEDENKVEVSFARRAPPKTEIPYMRWSAIKKAFEKHVGPLVNYPSKFQDLRALHVGFPSHLVASITYVSS